MEKLKPKKQKRQKPYKNRHVENDIIARNDLAVIIQDEIKVDPEYVENVIKRYEKMPGRFSLSFGDFSGNKDDIIREIKNLTKVGKDILMMQYRFENSEFGKQALKKYKQMGGVDD